MRYSRLWAQSSKPEGVWETAWPWATKPGDRGRWMVPQRQYLWKGILGIAHSCNYPVTGFFSYTRTVCQGRQGVTGERLWIPYSGYWWGFFVCQDYSRKLRWFLEKVFLFEKYYYTRTIPIQIPTFFSETKKFHPKIHIKSQGNLNNQNNLILKRTKLQDSCFLISKQITKHQKSKQCGTCIKRLINQQNRKPRNKSFGVWSSDRQQGHQVTQWRKERGLTSGAGKTRYLQAKE